MKKPPESTRPPKRMPWHEFLGLTSPVGERSTPYWRRMLTLALSAAVAAVVLAVLLSLVQPHGDLWSNVLGAAGGLLIVAAVAYLIQRLLRE